MGRDQVALGAVDRLISLGDRRQSNLVSSLRKPFAEVLWKRGDGLEIFCPLPVKGLRKLPGAIGRRFKVLQYFRKLLICKAKKRLLPGERRSV